MSHGNSSSKSENKTVTQASTQQQDQRVAATDAAIAVGPGNTGTINIDQLPDGIGDFADSFVHLLTQAQDAAIGAGQQAINIASNRDQDKKELLIIGAAALAVIALIARF